MGTIQDERIMAREQEGDALILIQALHQFKQARSGGGVQIRRGLVGQDDARPAGNGSGDGHPLLLPAAHLKRALVGQIAESDTLKQ